jgi:integrase
VVNIPPHILDRVVEHLASLVGPEADALVFPAPGGGYLRRSNFNRRVWRQACDAIGVAARFHDLRHTGATLAARTGASTAELMARLGHASPAAALRYQHATADRDRTIAEGLSELAEPAAVLPLHSGRGRAVTDGSRT